MQAAQHASTRIGVIVLHESFEDSQLLEGTFAVALQKKSALVGEHARLQNENDRQRSGNFLHRIQKETQSADQETAIVCLEHFFAQELQQICSITIVLHGGADRLYLRRRNVTGPV